MENLKIKEKELDSKLKQFLKTNNCLKQFIKNCNQSGLTEEQKKDITTGDKDAIIASFSWADTPEGHAYWSKLDDKWNPSRLNDNLELNDE